MAAQKKTAPQKPAKTRRPGRLAAEQDKDAGEFARRLRAAREERKLSQVELARMADVLDRSISQWESGAEPSLYGAMRVAVALGLPLDEIAPIVVMEQQKKKSEK